MFDIGFPELMLVAVVVLLVLGPERLPEALRTAGLWIGRLQRSFNSVKTEIEREIGMDDIRRQLHNESVMAEMRKLEQDLKANNDPRINGTLDSNNILPEDSLGFDQNADEPAAAQSSSTAAVDPESEAATVEQLDREAALARTATGDSTPDSNTPDSNTPDNRTSDATGNGDSGTDDEQRA